MFDYDLLILGSGPGGYVAAIRAAQLGLKTVIIEKDKLGGVCLNVGCIPSKALIHQAEIFHAGTDLQSMGIQLDQSKFDYVNVFNKSRLAATRLSKGVEFLMKKNQIDVISGTGVLTNPNQVTVNGERNITAKNIIIATGSRPRILPGFEFDGSHVLSSTDALMLQKLPAKLLIIGSGAIGLEFAHIFNAFGVSITVVEVMDQILPIEDAETVAVLRKSFERRGMTFLTSTKALKYESSSGKLTVTLEAADKTTSTLEVDQILVAVGRTTNTESIGLETLGIKTERGFVMVTDYFQTTIPGIYAIGDIVPLPQLAHVASKAGEIAVEHIAGLKPETHIRPDLIPSAVYTEPQIGSFGPTEAKLQQSGRTYAKATFPFRGVGKAVAVEQSEGLVKVLYDPKTKEILAAHLVGSEATEVVHEILLAKKTELLPEDIASMMHAHPTLSEVVMETMRAVEGWAIHA